MRVDIAPRNYHLLTYAIREIALVAELFKIKFDMTLRSLGIGDPIDAGNLVPHAVKQIVSQAALVDSSYKYSPTMGVRSARDFIAETRNKEGGTILKPENVSIYDGLGQAILNIYMFLDKDARIVGPGPSYATHSSLEAFHAGSEHLDYPHDPSNGWQPDLDKLERQIQLHPNIAGILIIGPNNPLGICYRRGILEGIVWLAHKYGLYIIADEIYANIVYADGKFISFKELIGDVPCLILRGLSKDVPWPGGRCGWIEKYNIDKDQQFAMYIEGLNMAKRLTVCSGTLPQAVLKNICSYAGRDSDIKGQCEQYQLNAKIAYEIFSQIEGVEPIMPEAAFYMTILFKDEALHGQQRLKIDNSKIVEFTNELIADPWMPYDKRLAIFLIAKAGIIVIPITGFNSKLLGIRITLLEPDIERFRQIITTLAECIKEYLAS